MESQNITTTTHCAFVEGACLPASTDLNTGKGAEGENWTFTEVKL